MFKSAVLKLTAGYVAALVAVCLVFSIPIYAVTATRLRNGAMSQTEYVRNLPRPFNATRIIPQLEELRERQLIRDRQQLLFNLILINACIVGLGAYASYVFARRTLKPIEEAHAAQARFTANASHELRTPLAVMQTEIDVAMRNKKLTTTEAREILQSNLEEVARLRQLSDQLLGLTRTGNEAVQKQRIDMTKLVTAQIAKLSKRHKQTFQTDIAKNVSTMGDPVLLGQVLEILVDNAVAYGGKGPQVAIKLAARKDTAIITVSDKGPGIPKEEQARIFDRFYRGKQATASRPNGHGLGLALAKDIALRHGGDVSVSSKPGKGATFALVLSLSKKTRNCNLISYQDTLSLGEMQLLEPQVRVGAQQA